MDKHVADYYHQARKNGHAGNFHYVLPLHMESGHSWEELTTLSPLFPRGWYELAHLRTSDRIEFTREHWLARLPFHPHAMQLIQNFFDRLDDIGIYIVQKTPDAPHEAHMVYSIRNDSGFFWGLPPVEAETWNQVQQYFSKVIFPPDYEAFIHIHDGFGKQMDTGMITSKSLAKTYETLQMFIEQGEPLRTAWGELVDPRTLLPFYESFALHCYQCFWTEWYPGPEMGNVYYSGIDRALTLRQKDEPGADVISFPTFVDWLAFYVEAVT